MRRIIMLLSVALVMAAMVVVMATPAFAQGCKAFGTTGTADLAKEGGIGQTVSGVAQQVQGLGDDVIPFLHELGCE